MEKLKTAELRVKIADNQLEFIENRARELGLSSKAELIRWYIMSDMAGIINVEREQNKVKKERGSLEGVISGSTVTDEDFEEAKKRAEKIIAMARKCMEGLSEEEISVIESARLNKTLIFPKREI